MQYGRYKGFRGGDGAGPAIGWQIYSLLERFIRIGPLGAVPDDMEDAHMHVCVKTINIDVQTPPNIDPSFFRPPNLSMSRRRMRDESTWKNHVLDPAYLANFIASEIEHLLTSRDPEWFSYGKVLFEHVDYVRVSSDGGTAMKEFDVAQCLKDAGPFPERKLSKERLEEYKKEVWKERATSGLRVLQ